MPAEPVVTLLVCFFHSHARLRVRQRIRRFLLPLLFEGMRHQPGRIASREREPCVEERLLHPRRPFPGCCAARLCFGAGALLIRGLSSMHWSRLCEAALPAASRPGHESERQGVGSRPSMIGRTSSVSLRYARDDDV